MAQGLLPIQLATETRSFDLTRVAGLLPYADLAAALGLRNLADTHVGVAGRHGWTDAGVLLSLVFLNLVGGDCVDDLPRLAQDAGFAAIMKRLVTQGMSASQRRVFKRRFRRGGTAGVPSTSVVHRYLKGFVDPAAEAGRGQGKAFIPRPSAGLLGLRRLNAELVAEVARRTLPQTATLDQDATLIATEKSDAYFGYKHFRSYQPMNVWWDELRVMLHTEFRDGNVPADYQNLRVLTEALSLLPPTVKTVRFRADTAGYEIDLLRYLAEGKHPRFGVIEFAIGADVTPEFRKAVGELRETDFQPFVVREADGTERKTEQQWADVCFSPNSLSTKKDGPAYRFLAIREPLKQHDLPGLEQDPKTLPFPTYDPSSGKHKLFGIVTNRDIPANELIQWHRERCGRSEQVHSVLKSDLAGGSLPSGAFGANAAWWWIAIVAHNLDAAMRALVLGPQWLGRRMKAMRFQIIHTAARVVHHARELAFRLGRTDSVADLLRTMRSAILALVQDSS